MSVSGVNSGEAARLCVCESKCVGMCAYASQCCIAQGNLLLFHIRAPSNLLLLCAIYFGAPLLFCGANSQKLSCRVCDQLPPIPVRNLSHTHTHTLTHTHTYWLHHSQTALTNKPSQTAAVFMTDSRYEAQEITLLCTVCCRGISSTKIPTMIVMHDHKHNNCKSAHLQTRGSCAPSLLSFYKIFYFLSLLFSYRPLPNLSFLFEEYDFFFLFVIFLPPEFQKRR